MSMWVEMRISNPAQSDRGKTFRLLVDSEAHHSVIPAAEARALGLEAHAIEDFELANGARVRYPVCTALFEYAGKTRGAPLILGEPDVYLVGALTLEALALVLDPSRQELMPMPVLYL